MTTIKITKDQNKLIALFLIMYLILNFTIVSEALCADKVKTLTLSSWDTVKGSAVPTWEKMIKDIEAATNGKVTVKMFHSQALGKAKEHYEMAVARTADFTFLNIGFTPGRFPITDLAGFAHAPSGEILSSGVMSLLENGYLEKEYAKVKPLYLWSTSPSHFIWSKQAKAARNLEELKGKKIRVATSGAANLMKALGAVPVAIPMPEVYTALERGVIDATFTCICVMEIFGLHQICDKITIADGPGMAFALIMNKKSWEELPDEAKNVLDKNRREYTLMAGKNGDAIDQRSLKQYNPTLYHLSKDEMNLMKKLSAKELESYVNKYEGLGFPARKAADTYWNLMNKKYGVEPFIWEK